MKRQMMGVPLHPPLSIHLTHHMMVGTNSQILEMIRIVLYALFHIQFENVFLTMNMILP
jgi:hypothetical protein